MTPTDILQIIIFVITLMILHESGHVISAKIMGLDIQKISFQFKPYPHFFVAIEWPKLEKQRLIYLFSGSFITIFLFIVALSFHFFGIRNVYYAFVFQLILESNPFYSDITIAAATKNKLDYTNTQKPYADLYQEQFSSYQFSYRWYIHFTIWIAFILFLTKYNHLFT